MNDRKGKSKKTENPTQKQEEVRSKESKTEQKQTSK
jgi:hypothetical protein